MTLPYDQAVQRLLWLGLEGRGLKWDLNNVRAVLERLGHPERRFASVHIAGTNGKGSVAAMTEAVLRTSGRRTGLYTSPHLERINERITVAGEAISDEEFARAFAAVAEVIENLLAEGVLPHHPSYFECLTAMALWHFAEAGVEVAVLEVGLGGRLDATNVVTPEVSVITAIDFDHERYLGHAIEQIAGEKAGIIKPGVSVVNAATHPVARRVVAERAAALGAPVMDVESAYNVAELRWHDFGCPEFVVGGPDGWTLPIRLGLRGSFQVENALAAVAAVRVLTSRGWPVSDAVLAEGLAAARWPGRLELVERDPLVILDGAHNPAGARQVVRFWEEHLTDRRIHLVYGTMRDKAVAEVAELLFPRAASVTVTRPATPRAASTELLSSLAHSLNPRVAVAPNAAEVLRLALEAAGPEDVVFAAGSLFLVGECRQALLARRPPSAAVAAPRAGTWSPPV